MGQRLCVNVKKCCSEEGVKDLPQKAVAFNFWLATHVERDVLSSQGPNPAAALFVQSAYLSLKAGEEITADKSWIECFVLDRLAAH